ncbi:DegT/DnrJ/EryC1/StrS family aminotransferase [Streptomyces sp. NPDC057702]|uniref:DegT/DnrJ/EryC1/StrS family aminotransferase n=1 Tax=unclassified Streptomyces TaxID=2593676 RepID=UPI0036C0AFE9
MSVVDSAPAVDTTPVPYSGSLLDPGARELLLETVREVATDPEQRFVLGRRTAELERRLRHRTGVGDVIACASGTSALSLALRAASLAPADEVIVPAFGAEPLAATVVGAGAVPVFADVDPLTMVIDVADAARRVTARTRALVPAHTFTALVDMRAVTELASAHGLTVIEDAAVAQDATLAGRAAGTWGHVGLYSFFPAKPFGMPGEGAAVLCDDPTIARTVRLLRNHGQDGDTPLRHEIGYHSGFDEVQAGFQLARLATQDARIARRARISAYYSQRFAPLCARGVLSAPAPGAEQGHYVYAVQSERRDALARHLAAHGIGTRVYYPLPLPRLPAFARYAPADARWPGAERASARHLALPLHPQLDQAQVRRIADAVDAFFR